MKSEKEKNNKNKKEKKKRTDLKSNHLVQYL